ncbi:MAG: cell filamentation protein Fic [Burkholderiales bacterium RIFCSPLOWO2_12_FULL_61_40]|nr:MAG: cell filamentation protein Fic [Burkholderiales bacterium RIFCSPLOWO2_12_FULL_61_40]
MPTPTTSTQPRYIWQHPAWPALAFDAAALAPDLDLARLEQGKLLGLLNAIGMAQAQEVRRELWVQEALATAAIEGENLNLESVRSSVAHRLGLADAPSHDRHVDGLVLVMQDAMENHQSALDLDRLCRWQSALFPGGTSGLARIAVGRLRDHADAMQIVSGPLGREVVHYQAPPSNQVAQELAPFLAWFASTRPAHSTAPVLHGVARAALAHLWFESIHPFEDGNGRLGRAVVDMALAQDLYARDPDASGSLVRVFGMARQMLKTRAAYYDGLNMAQRIQQPGPQGGAIDVTPWVRWFVEAFTQGCITCQCVVKQALDKSAFRLQAAQGGLNARQHKVLERLLEAGSMELGGGFLGGMTSDKYAKITSASKATATRDLTDLLAKGLLRVEGVGKATRYAVNVPGWSQPVV